MKTLKMVDHLIIHALKIDDPNIFLTFQEHFINSIDPSKMDNLSSNRQLPCLTAILWSFFVWGVTESDVTNRYYNMKQFFFNRIMEVLLNIPRE